MQNNTHWKLVHLNFGQTPVHFGEQGIGLEMTSERVRSDTLFSALVSAYAKLHGKSGVETLLQTFKNGPKIPPFRLSSTFIYRQNPRHKKNDSPKDPLYIYYLPRLMGQPPKYPTNDLEFTKIIRTLNYLPLQIWQRWYQGEGFSVSDRDQLIAKANKEVKGFEEKELDQAGTFDYGKAFAKSLLPKVAIDRIGHGTNFYHTGQVQFEWQHDHNKENQPSNYHYESIISLAGLYFLIQFPNPDSKIESELRGTLELLGEEGLGGERSSGAGRFEAEWHDLPSEWHDAIHFQGEHHGLISLFWEHPPLDTMLLTQSTRYTLQERCGWIVSPFSGQQKRRKAIQMFAEGSVFPVQPQGRLADVTPHNYSGGHNIYRSGIALSLPVKVLETPSG